MNNINLDSSGEYFFNELRNDELRSEQIINNLEKGNIDEVERLGDRRGRIEKVKDAVKDRWNRIKESDAGQKIGEIRNKITNKFQGYSTSYEDYLEESVHLDNKQEVQDKPGIISRVRNSVKDSWNRLNGNSSNRDVMVDPADNNIIMDQNDPLVSILSDNPDFINNQELKSWKREFLESKLGSGSSQEILIKGYQSLKDIADGEVKVKSQLKKNGNGEYQLEKLSHPDKGYKIKVTYFFEFEKNGTKYCEKIEREIFTSSNYEAEPREMLQAVSSYKNLIVGFVRGESISGIPKDEEKKEKLLSQHRFTFNAKNGLKAQDSDLQDVTLKLTPALEPRYVKTLSNADKGKRITDENYEPKKDEIILSKKEVFQYANYSIRNTDTNKAYINEILIKDDYIIPFESLNRQIEKKQKELKEEKIKLEKSFLFFTKMSDEYKQIKADIKFETNPSNKPKDISPEMKIKIEAEKNLVMLGEENPDLETLSEIYDVERAEGQSIPDWKKEIEEAIQTTIKNAEKKIKKRLKNFKENLLNFQKLNNEIQQLNEQSSILKKDALEMLRDEVNDTQKKKINEFINSCRTDHAKIEKECDKNKKLINNLKNDLSVLSREYEAAKGNRNLVRGERIEAPRNKNQIEVGDNFWNVQTDNEVDEFYLESDTDVGSNRIITLSDNLIKTDEDEFEEYDLGE